MKHSYPKIQFVYSSPYDRVFTEYENNVFSDKQAQEIKEFIEKLQFKWDKINNSVCRALEKIIGSKLQEREMKCYIIKYWKYNGLSSPLTIKMDDDFDVIYSTLIHELVHILIVSNSDKYKKVWSELKKRFPNEIPRVILHIYVNFIQLQVLRKLFKQDFVNKIINREANYKEVERAWEIVLKEEKKLMKLFRIG